MSPKLAMSLCLLGACATQAPATRPPNGISVTFTDEVKCRIDGAPSDGAAQADALCSALVSDLKTELGRVGFTVVEAKNDANALGLRLSAVEKLRTSDENANLTVQMRVNAQGSEVESLAESSPPEIGDQAGLTSAVARALARGLASSPRIRARGAF